MQSFTTPISGRPVAYSAHICRSQNSNIHRRKIVCSLSKNSDQDTQLSHTSRRLTLLAPLLALGVSAVLPRQARAIEDLPPPPQSAEDATAPPPLHTPPAPSSPLENKSPSSSNGISTEQGSETQTSKVPKGPSELSEAAAKKLSQEEEERKKGRKRGKGRIRELQEIRAELAEKELVLLEKQEELLEKEQTVMVLREELEIERKLRELLAKDVKKAEEQAALAMGLCGVGGSMLP